MEETEVVAGEDTDVEEKEPVAPWLETGDNGDQKVIPQVAHMRIKSKLQERVADKESKISELEEKIARLEQGGAAQAQPMAQAPPEKPKRADFDDDDEYFEAVDTYMDKSIQDRFSRMETQTAQQTAQQQVVDNTAKAVDDHYKRVASLIEESGISEDVYLDSHRTVQTAVGAAYGNDGDAITKELISRIGEGSEKVITYLGRNHDALNAFKARMSEDKSGLTAMIYLGELRAKLSNPMTKTSSAPAPATEIPGGDAGVTLDSGDALKKYRAAHKKGDTATAINVKLDAKKAGVDVSGW